MSHISLIAATLRSFCPQNTSKQLKEVCTMSDMSWEMIILSVFGAPLKMSMLRISVHRFRDLRH